MSLSRRIPDSIEEPLAAVVRSPRRALVRARDGLDRARHPRRHARARRRVAERVPVRGVLFVCLGNICRSPYAEVRLRALLEATDPRDSIRVGSAGFVLPGRPSPSEARAAAGDRGLDLGGHRSGVLSNELLRGADLVFAMTSEQSRQLRYNYGRPDTLHLGDLEPPPIPRRDLPDPFGRPAEAFEAVYARLDRAVGTLAGILAGKVGSADPPSRTDARNG